MPFSFFSSSPAPLHLAIGSTEQWEQQSASRQSTAVDLFASHHDWSTRSASGHTTTEEPDPHPVAPPPEHQNKSRGTTTGAPSNSIAPPFLLLCASARQLLVHFSLEIGIPVGSCGETGNGDWGQGQGGIGVAGRHSPPCPVRMTSLILT